MKAKLLLTVAFTAFLFTACNQDDLLDVIDTESLNEVAVQNQARIAEGVIPFTV